MAVTRAEFTAALLNVAAAAVELTAGDLHDIESAASQIKVEGARYSEAAQRMINR